jgi:hypothetical protein
MGVDDQQLNGFWLVLSVADDGLVWLMGDLILEDGKVLIV